MCSFKTLFVGMALPFLRADNSYLGKGFDMSASNLWEISSLVPFTIFNQNFTGESIADIECSHGAQTINQNYTDTASWYQEFTKETGLEVGFDYHGLDLSVGDSLGQSDYYAWWDVRASTYVETYNVQKCQGLSDSFARYSSLSEDLIQSLKDLPLTPDDKDTMDLWKAAFIHRFGSHYAVQTSHGARIKTLTSIEASCEASMDCLLQQTCLTISFVAIYSQYCVSQEECKVSEGCEETMSIECAINGGDSSMTPTNLCSANATEEELDAFLQSGDLTSSSSVIDIQFSSLADLIAGAGYYDQFKQVSQAISYAGCHSPWLWKPVSTDPADGHSCQCDLSCANGGTLDAASCTCSCVGDEAHGWSGVDCTQTYGKCQCAPGSMNNGADQCCVVGNVCGSNHASPQCTDTDVCCNKDQYATCCPFGYSCDPSGTEVKCMANSPANVLSSLLM
jgi:hypothetical protein